MLRRPPVTRRRPGLLCTAARSAATPAAGPSADTITPGFQAPASAPPAPGAQADAAGAVLVRLRQLDDLHTAGVLTDDEFALAKSRLLGL